MWLYLILILIPLLAYLLFNEELGHSVIFLATYLLFLSLFVGLSDMLGGYDRYVYGQIFDSLADDMAVGRNLLQSAPFQVYTKEIGFDVYNICIAFFTSNRYIFILITTLIIYLLLFVSFKKYLTNYPIGLFFFMALWFFFTFTYLRQVMAACIGFLSLNYVVERKLYKFLIVVGIAATFHNSALILLPFYFLPLKKHNPNNIILVMILCLIIGATGWPSNVFDVYANVTSEAARFARYNEADNSFRFAYVFEVFFFLYVILSNYELFDKNNVKDVVNLNMMLCFCAILLLFVKSSNGGRMGWYFMLGVIMSISKVLQKTNQRKFFLCIVIPLFLFLYIRVYTGWQVFSSLYPYKTFLTDGHRQGDVIWRDCEYDNNYDRDKLYR